MNTKQISRYLASFFFVSVVLVSCGAPVDQGGGAGGGGGNNPGGNSGDGNPKKGPLSLAECETYWESYQRAHPKGLKLRYENQGMGAIVYEDVEVLESTNTLVREVRIVQNQRSETTQTKASLVQSCTTQGNTGDQSSLGELLAERNESKTVRAGTFTTRYIKYQITPKNSGTNATTQTETWIYTSARGVKFPVLSKTLTNTGNLQFQYTSELLSVIVPE